MGLMATSTCSAMASQALFLQPHHNFNPKSFSLFPNSPKPLPSSLSFSDRAPAISLSVSLSSPSPRMRSIRAVSQTAPIPLKSKSPNSSTNPNPHHPLTALFAVAVAIVRMLSSSIPAVVGVSQSLGHAVGPAFFAAVRDRQSAYLNTPLTVVAAGLAKWLDIYSGVLMVRVLPTSLGIASPSPPSATSAILISISSETLSLRFSTPSTSAHSSPSPSSAPSAPSSATAEESSNLLFRLLNNKTAPFSDPGLFSSSN
ncbi:hypothetical protein L484_010021 [Morus notabilis]|uniref:Uncharacterized protein n=1 Tax=Morus notabilis TaxID=981085 RepID=W9QQQ9_9ROSA|nr:hypothetical protein L484_010021 [Morus notabilis]